MRRAAFVVPFALLGAVLAGCAPTTISGTSEPASTITSKVTVTVPPPNVAVPPELPASISAQCPYLSSDEVQNDNGQHVASVKISSSSDGQPHPVCYFYRPDGHLQMTVRVYVGTSAIATALVNQAAPISTSDPADQPPGWTGGSMALKDGAVYAVAKGGTAIIATSNQLQTIKCRLVVTAVASSLG